MARRARVLSLRTYISPLTALVIRIALQQLCYARGYIPHGQNPNISLNHIRKYSREERALCAESSEKLTGEQFHTYFFYKYYLEDIALTGTILIFPRKGPFVLDPQRN